MPLRGMGRMNLIPEVPLRFTPGYSRLAAPRQLVAPNAVVIQENCEVQREGI
jgi:hypothetical protein